MGALLCPHHSPAAAGPATGPSERPRGRPPLHPQRARTSRPRRPPKTAALPGWLPRREAELSRDCLSSPGKQESLPIVQTSCGAPSAMAASPHLAHRARTHPGKLPTPAAGGFSLRGFEEERRGSLRRLPGQFLPTRPQAFVSFLGSSFL